MYPLIPLYIISGLSILFCVGLLIQFLKFNTQNTQNKVKLDTKIRELEAGNEKLESLPTDVKNIKQEINTEKEKVTTLSDIVDNVRQELMSEKENYKNLLTDFNNIKNSDRELNKRVVHLSCKLKILEIKTTLEELNKRSKKVKNALLLKGIGKLTFRMGLLAVRLLILPSPDFLIDIPEIAGLLGDLDIDPLLPEDHDFDMILQMYRGINDTKDVNLNSMNLQDLEKAEKELEKTLQELNDALKNQRHSIVDICS